MEALALLAETFVRPPLRKESDLTAPENVLNAAKILTEALFGIAGKLTDRYQCCS